MKVTDVCPKCGGKLTVIDGLEGVWCKMCDTCFYDIALPTSTTPANEVIRGLYSEERCKRLKGVPHNTLSVGSESKGRTVISYPVDATPEERKILIDSALSDLEYLLSQVKERGLDIMTTRGKKNE